MRTRFAFIAVLFLASFPLSAQTLQLTDGASTTPWLAVGTTRVATVWQQGQSRINASILDPLGRVVTPPFDVGSAPPYSPPRAAAVGDTFLVVWRDLDASPNTFLLRGAIIDARGLVQGPFTIATVSGGLGYLAVSGDTTRFLVGWYDGSVSRAAWVNTAGVVESNFVVVPDAFITSIVTRGDAAVAVWYAYGTDQLKIGLTVIAGSTALHSAVIAAMPAAGGFGTPYLYAPSIAYGESGYYVAWLSGRSGRESNVEGTRVAADLTPLDVDPSHADGHHAGATSIRSDYGSTHAYEARVSAAGPRFLVSWIQDNPTHDIVKARYVEADGQPSSAVSFPAPFPGPAPVAGSTTALPNGTPIAAYTVGGGRLLIRIVGGGPRLRTARR